MCNDETGEITAYVYAMQSARAAVIKAAKAWYDGTGSEQDVWDAVRALRALELPHA